MKTLQIKISIIVLIFIMALLPLSVFADAVEGSKIITLGADLNNQERSEILDLFQGGDEAVIIEVTNREEHQYLGDIIPAGKIGSKAISSSMVTYLGKGKGIDIIVDDHITYITPATYRNALITAGITDAKVHVAAPVNVTGTAALTGIMKAYEKTTGQKISEEVKKVANEEMVVSSEIQEEIGEDKTNDLINTIKVQMAKKVPKNEEEVRLIINNVSNQYNINLTDQQVEKMVQLFQKMKNSNIDWDQVERQARKYSTKAKEYSKKAKDYLASEEGQQMLEESKSWFIRFIDWIKSLFA